MENPTFPANDAKSNQLSPNMASQSHLKKKGEFFEASDIIPPKDLAGKVFGKDYILVAHNPGEGVTESVQTNGLMSLQRLAYEAGASDEVIRRFKFRSQQLHFGNDPRLIYFRPVIQNHHPISKDSVVLAIHPNAVNIFDQERRVNNDDQSYSFSQNIYRNFSMKFEEYAKKLTDLPPGSFLNQYGYPVRYGQLENMRQCYKYIPEAAIMAAVIESNLFVDHSTLHEQLKGLYLRA